MFSSWTNDDEQSLRYPTGRVPILQAERPAAKDLVLRVLCFKRLVRKNQHSLGLAASGLKLKDKGCFHLACLRILRQIFA
jgi:hypothetical protein